MGADIMNNEEIMVLGQKYLMNNYKRFPLAPVKGEGSKVWDADGKEYIDFVMGLAVNSLGHSNKDITQVMCQQGEKILHTSNLYWVEPQAKLAKKLVDNSVFDKAFFANSGAEANEAAIKLARKYSMSKYGENRYEIITLEKSFHGRTMATLTATGQEKVQKGFAPLVEGFKYVALNDFQALEKTVSEKTAAIMIELVQGEGGVNAVEKDYVEKIEKLCKSKDILLIIDEIQTGISRTGKLFAYENYGITPDIMTLAKALGNGAAIGAMLAVDSVAEAFQPGDHGTTFGGNFLATSIGNKVMDIMLEEKIWEKAEKMGSYMMDQLNALKADFPSIVEVRGLGLLIGVEIEGESMPVVEKAIENGLLLSAAGPNVVRFLPALNVDKETVDKGLEIFKKTLGDL